MRCWLNLLLVVLLVATASTSLVSAAFVKPLTPYRSYDKGEPVVVLAHPLRSIFVDVFAHDHLSLGFCGPTSEAEQDKFDATLGERLLGDNAHVLPMNVTFMQNTTCQVMCTKTYSPEQSTRIIKAAEALVQHHWTIGDIPINNGFENYRRARFPMGNLATALALNNDFTITVYVNEYDMITAAEARVASLRHAASAEDSCAESAGLGHRVLTMDTNATVTYSYSVLFIRGDPSWSYEDEANELHVFSLVNNIVVLLVILATFFFVVIRALRSDFARYERLDDESPAEEAGWKLVHGDVFRAPRRPLLLAALVGSGVQVALAAILTVFFAAIGVVSEFTPGSIASCVLFTYAIFGAAAGFVAARLYKSLGGERWKSLLLVTGTAFPGLLFLLGVIANGVKAAHDAADAASTGTVFVVLAVWIFLLLPLCLIAGLIGFRTAPISFPVKINTLPRFLPQHSPFFARMVPIIVVCGLVSLAPIGIEWVAMTSALYSSNLYVWFPYLLTALIMFLAQTATQVVLFVYLRLRAENYHWWWVSFIAPAAVGIPIFVQSAFNLLSHNVVFGSGGSGVFNYFIVVIIAALTFSIMAGAAGMLACLWFTRKIYASIKIS
ncbi:hypothetical protein CAOG_004425 [Capsaspora owczarzaki ATCC 30864]|uniref:Transmembrane 9 superfamily member n=2 Tax=Capsaspora owczarzaki (strain ATCC 30864) TaxID=595528 RepID=A0A0D2UF04_CAPO3|nr:hypothetical protein CAOG_004425 [Capsaspora owczarzaki ATCC 30864]